MYPLNAKQQKSSRLMNKISPEVKAIQEKYKGKNDQASQLKMNEETQALYAKYGISPFGGCLPLLITFPILWCLYRVMYNIGDYIPALKEESAAYFLGLNVNMSPMEFFRDKVNHPYGWVAFIIPILAMALQFINTKLLQSNTNTNNSSSQDAMAQSMKTMNYFMPIMSGFFCISLNMGIGLYWIVGSLFRIFQCITINRSVDKISMDDLIEKNKEKAAKKNAKLEERNRQMQEYAKTRTSNIKTASSYQNKPQDNSNEDKKDYSTKENDIEINKDVEPGSISGYAHMLSGKSGKDK
jgi:YidC/Oxa1 family membrane protein insertase